MYIVNTKVDVDTCGCRYLNLWMWISTFVDSFIYICGCGYPKVKVQCLKQTMV